MVTHLTKTFKDEPSSPRTFRMSKEEILQRIKQVEAQIRTMKEEAERERGASRQASAIHRSPSRAQADPYRRSPRRGRYVSYRQAPLARRGTLGQPRQAPVNREYSRHQGASEGKRTNPNRGASAKSPQPRAEH